MGRRCLLLGLALLMVALVPLNASADDRSRDSEPKTGISTADRVIAPDTPKVTYVRSDVVITTDVRPDYRRNLRATAELTPLWS